MLSTAQVDALHSMARAWSHLDFALIGASALDVFGLFEWRRTDDLDVSIAIAADEIEGAVAQLPGWSRVAAHRWQTADSLRVDILPVGSKPGAIRAIRWPTGETMRLQGFHHVFALSESIDVSGVRIRVAPPPVVFLLKVYALLDDPQRVDKDLGDVAHLLESYVSDDDERRFHEGVLDTGLPFEAVPAYLLGVDVAAFAEDSDRDALEDFLARATDNSDLIAGSLARLAPARWRRNETTTASMLGAFARGLRTR